MSGAADFCPDCGLYDCRTKLAKDELADLRAAAYEVLTWIDRSTSVGREAAQRLERALAVGAREAEPEVVGIRFTAPDQLPVGAKVRVVRLGDDCNPQIEVGDILTVVSIGFDDDHLEIFKGDEVHTDDAGVDCYFANKGIGTWVRTVELVTP